VTPTGQYLFQCGVPVVLGILEGFEGSDMILFVALSLNKANSSSNLK